MNVKVLLVLVGIVAGALIGWVTRPAAVELQIGAVTIEIQGNQTAGGEGGRLTSEQWRHIAIFTAIGAVIGLGIGLAVDRRGNA